MGRIEGQMRREIREEINAHARHFLGSGRAKSLKKALELANEATRCGARTRKGTPCRCRGRGKGRKCKLHGGASTGPRTKAGLARSLAAARAGWERWQATRRAASAE
ncbi:MAG: HGGxSTG domain-containing protein [Rhodomicrobium sp.]